MRHDRQPIIFDSLPPGQELNRPGSRWISCNRARGLIRGHLGHPCLRARCKDLRHRRAPGWRRAMFNVLLFSK
jgi:hypothetical protein